MSILGFDRYLSKVLHRVNVPLFLRAEATQRGAFREKMLYVFQQMLLTDKMKACLLLLFFKLLLLLLVWFGFFWFFWGFFLY